MERDEILKRSREENSGKISEYEEKVYADASRKGIFIGSILFCIINIASILLPKTSDICAAVLYVAVNALFAGIIGIESIIIYRRLGSKIHLLIFIISIIALALSLVSLGLELALS